MFETYRGIVYPQQEDHMGHMNVAWYTSKFDEATWHMLAHIGITPAYIRESNKGMAALEITYKYLAEVSAGDLLVVRSEIKEMRDKTILFKHTMFDSITNTPVATMQAVGVHMDREARKSFPFPAHARERYEALLPEPAA
ncbi:bifunctional 3-hydroxyacyl-CoA dehydrogenase/thioesterase [Pseudovibrio sp. Ad46]|uniref:acyl-CoA thioesterase n=1 Tax=unclassified Pseudovibrio TaxID=2627060 RepID=UPI0007AE6054|nr:MULTISPECIES: thioesterase family protein [unclassified Pseudovibrio]KZK80108.1 bifunctional 3-hydroxyacyl-CoA dehydrogenase/thioesterase [Pseudovibrio sp. Ad46]KZK99491.1 bifunctional 3-hydroxyacyl-CoA dehydrogenase/thioesterase [Pseudovibrio sp. Ad5]